MRDPRLTIHDYTPESFERVRQTLLHVATVLGAWMEQVTVIGGAVPSLLVPQSALPAGVEPHPGTMDVDLGLELTILDDEGYASVSELLRAAGYRPAVKGEDRILRQTWRSDPSLGIPVTVDFLVPRSPRHSPADRLQHLEKDFAAVIADGLQLVQRDRRQVRLTGRTLRGEAAERSVWISGPASFIVLKARALHLREKPKDAYDLHYVLASTEEGLPAIADSLRSMLDDRDAQEAVQFLERDYATVDCVGPARAAYFLYGEPQQAAHADIDALRASAHAYVQKLLAIIR